MSASPRRTQEERRAATRSSIIDAARELFTEHGYNGCSVDAILERAGSSKGAFYHHFPDKSAVLEALIEEFEQEGLRRVVEWTAGITSTLEVMRAATANFLDWCTDPTIRQIVLIDALPVLGFERWHAIDDRYTLDLVEATLRRGIDRGELRPLPSVRAMARLIIGATNELALVVANAPDPAAARDDAISAFEVLFASLAAGSSKDSA
jgi:AcrR family transcriptional regulator